MRDGIAKTNLMPLPALARVKDKQLKTLRLFRSKAEAGAWGGIHHAHFDWWMFPIGKLSLPVLLFVIRSFNDVAGLRES